MGMFHQASLARRIVAPVLCATLGLTCALTGQTVRAATSPTPEALVDSLFTILNAMNAGSAHADLSTVYAANVTFSIANTKGVTKTLHGLATVEKWESAWSKANPGLKLTTVSVRAPMPGMIAHYEIASTPAKPLLARCAHFFAVEQGKIVSDDWVTYYSAQ